MTIFKKKKSGVNKCQLAKDRALFDRQPGETNKVWEAFIIFRDLGTNRTLKRAGELYRLNNPQITSSEKSLLKMFSNYSSQWKWRERAAAWDNELDRIGRAKQIREIEKMKDRHTQLSLAVQNIVSNEIKKYIKLSQGQKDVLFDFGMTLKALETAVKLERMSRGEPESIVEERKEATTEEKRAVLSKFVADEDALCKIDELMQQDDSE